MVRYLRALSTGLLLVLAACEEEAPEDTKPDLPDDNDVVEPTPGDRYIDVGAIAIDAVFGYDAGTGQVVSVSAGANTIVNALYVTFFDAEWDPYDPETSGLVCDLVISLDGAGPAAPLGDADRWYQLDPAPNAPVVTTCHDPGSSLDPNEWPADIVQAFGSPSSYSIVIGQGIVSPKAPVVFGGYFGVNPGIGIPAEPGNGEVYVSEGFGFELDPAFALVDDGTGNPSVLLVDDIFNNGQALPTAAYQMRTAFQTP